MDELDPVFESVARYFALLAEPTRLKILHALCHGERSVQQIVETTGLTQSNASRQLNAMHRAGTMARRKEGNLVFYRVSDEALVELCRSVCVRIAGQIEGGEKRRQGLMDLVDGMGLYSKQGLETR